MPLKKTLLPHWKKKPGPKRTKLTLAMAFKNKNNLFAFLLFFSFKPKLPPHLKKQKEPLQANNILNLFTFKVKKLFSNYKVYNINNNAKGAFFYKLGKNANSLTYPKLNAIFAPF